MSARIGSLFSGSGMLDEAVRAVLPAEVAWHSDVDSGACKVLAYRYPGVPNLGDVSAVDWSTVPPVDILTGGFPCQDVSHAGARKGMGAATRSGLWARMCDAIDALRPPMVIAENVRGLTSACAESDMGICPRCLGGAGPHNPLLRGLGRVLGDLAELGYDAQWFGLPASDVGAPHERFRIFIVAADTRGEHGGQWRATAPGQAASGWSLGQPARRGRARLVADAGHGASDGQRARAEPGTGSTPADPERGRRDGRTREPVGRSLGRAAATGTGQDTAPDTDRDALREQPVTEPRRGSAAAAGLHREAATDAHSDGRARLGRQQPSQRHTHRRSGSDIAWGIYEPAIRRWEALTRPAPAPTERGTRGGQRLSRWFDEWMMGWPDGWVTDVSGVTYSEAIRLCGNGVVPQQAAAALSVLFAHLPSVAA